MRALVLLCVVTGAVLVYLLAQGPADTTDFARHTPALLGLGALLALGLAGLIARQLFLLRGKLRARMFGARLTLRLMLVLALMALIPGGLVYALAYQFIQKSIDSWFEVRIDRALEGGLNLARNALEQSLREHEVRAAELVRQLAAQPPSKEALLSLSAASGLEHVSLLDERGRALLVVDATGFPADGTPPEAQVLAAADQAGSISAVYTLPDGSPALRAVFRVSGAPMSGERYLQALQRPPAPLAADARAADKGWRDYQGLTLARNGLKQLFGLTLTLAMLLTLLSAIFLAFLLSERLSAPLSALAEATRAISKGDYTRLNPVRSRDEFGVLTQSFNTMTRQISDAALAMERNQRQLENAKGYLEDILSNLSSGVLSFDERLYLKTVNAAAYEILGVPSGAFHGLKLPEWPQRVPPVSVFGTALLARLGELAQSRWEEQIEYRRGEALRTLLVRGTRLSARGEAGFVVVFDDITHLAQAQRDAAWGEVARRLAHEIKNPLTPIQLSAERLQRKLLEKLPEPEADVLKRATGTIVNQVTALKGMVDDFSLYARSARMSAETLSLNELVREVLVLYESMGVAIEPRLAEGLPPIAADPGLLRQVLHNLIQNALDAMSGLEAPRLVVRSGFTGRDVELSIEDNGAGIDEAMIDRIFEPYVTTKTQGTGLGLAIVKKIIEEHHGRIQVSNVKPRGALVSIAFPFPAAA